MLIQIVVRKLQERPEIIAKNKIIPSLESKATEIIVTI